MAYLDDLLSDSERPALMGVLNTTPDSFYDGGEYDSLSCALERARDMVDAGVDIIDVGGESTRPGAGSVDVAREINRVVPVVEAINQELPVPISVDTSKAEVADTALRNGAVMVNDVTGLENEALRSVVVDHGCSVCIMHMQGTPETMQSNPTYDSVLRDVRNYLTERADGIVEMGLDPGEVIIDPGIGFGKTLEQNRDLLTGVASLKDSGFPVMVGHSRKSFMGSVLDNNAGERLASTLAVSSRLCSQGVDMIRVHDVKPHTDFFRMVHWLERDEVPVDDG